MSNRDRLPPASVRYDELQVIAVVQKDIETACDVTIDVQFGTVEGINSSLGAVGQGKRPTESRHSLAYIQRARSSPRARTLVWWI